MATERKGSNVRRLRRHGLYEQRHRLYQRIFSFSLQ